MVRLVQTLYDPHNNLDDNNVSKRVNLPNLKLKLEEFYSSILLLAIK